MIVPASDLQQQHHRDDEKVFADLAAGSAVSGRNVASTGSIGASSGWLSQA